MSRTYPLLASLLLAACCLWSSSARATTPATLDLTAVPQGAALSIEEGKKQVVSFTPKTKVEDRAQVTVQRVEVSGHTLIEARIQIRTEQSPPRTEVWVAMPGAGSAAPVFWDSVGALDADGEAVSNLWLTPSGVFLGQTMRRLSRCDGEPAWLFLKQYDFSARVFKPTTAPLPAAAATALTAKRGTDGMPTGAPLGGFFFTAASSSENLGTDVTSLAPPAAVNDGNPATVWQAAKGSHGKGEFLTARSSGGFPITGLRLLPGDTRAEKDYQNSRRPRALTLIFSAKERVDVTLMEDSDGGKKRYQTPFWIPLPKPVESGCVTVLVRETTPGKAPLAIAGIEVMTELDGPTAAERLLADMAADTSCIARRALFQRIGENAMTKLLDTIKRTPASTGRECLVETLAGMIPKDAKPSSEVVDALVTVIPRATHAEVKVLQDLLTRLPTPPSAPLLAIIRTPSTPDADRLLASRILLTAPSPSDIEAMLALLGQGQGTFRASLRAQLQGSKARFFPTVLAAVNAHADKTSGQYADLLLVLGSQARYTADTRADALPILTSALVGGNAFEVRARAISALALLDDDAAILALAEAREKVGDPILRQFIVAELARSARPAAIPGLRDALGDTDPKVRELAAEGVGRFKDKGAAPILIKGAEQEPWPMVRRAEVSALGELCTAPGNELLLRAYQRDETQVRQAGMVGLAKCKDHRALTVLIRTLGREPEHPDMRSLAARLLGEQKDRRTVGHIAEALTRLLVESQADLALEGVVSDVAMALATIGGTQAANTVATIVDDPRPSVARMGVDALARMCAEPVAVAALKKAMGSKDEAISIPARTAHSHCLAPR